MTSKVRWSHCLPWLIVLVALSVSRAAQSADDAYTAVVNDYINGNWDQLSGELKSRAREITALPAAQKSDVDYIRRTVLECRPDWWAACKAGRLVRFRPVVWGHAISATFDPDARTELSITYTTAGYSVVVKWNAADMDSPTIKGELKFTQADHVDLDIWRALGTAQSRGLIPPRSQINLSQSDQLALQRYLMFRGNVAGAYYATPSARRLALWEGISGWSHEYDKEKMYMPQRAIGAMYAAEVLSHPENYPAIKWPAAPPAEGAESKMIWEFQKWIRYHPLTFNEDRALREAIKAFAAANEGKTRQTGIVTLPNKLSLALDPDADKPLSALRDAWIKERYAKTPQHP